MKDKDFAGFYCGTMRGASTGVMDTFPSRFGVSVRSVQDKFSIDGFMGTTLTLQWLKDHQATGVFMNAGDWKGGPKSNVFMDRVRAWTDPATGIVWIPMYCTCDIPAGDFLRWRYRPVDGEGEFTPLTPKCRVLFDLVGGEGLPVGVWFHFLVGCWMECESRTDLNKQGRAGELCS